MKKILLAAVAIFTIGSASSSFAGGCGTSYAPVYQNHYQPSYHYVEPCHQQVITVPVYHKKVIIQQPCHTTYVKPVVHTYQTPVYHNTYDYGCHTPVYNYNYTSSYGSHGGHGH